MRERDPMIEIKRCNRDIESISRDVMDVMDVIETLNQSQEM